MEKCKFCQAELAENGTFCPNCGKNNAQEEMTAEVTAEETVQPEMAQDVSEEAVSVQEAPAQETAVSEEVPSEPEKKKATPGKIALAVCAVVVLAAALIALIMTGMNGKTEEEAVPGETTAVEATAVATVPADGNPEDVTCKGSYTVSDEEVLANRDTVVAAIGDNQLTNGQLQVYYWSMVNSYLNSEYGYYMMMYGMLDHTQPLDTQMSTENEELTWQQFFLSEALNYWQMCLSLAEESEAAGMKLSTADQEYLDNLKTSLEETAASHEMTLDELMLNNIGPGAGLEEFTAFQSLYLNGKDFYQAELEKLKPTQEDLETFFAEHEADYASTGISREDTFVDVRHILVMPKGGTTDENGTTTYSDAEWAACEAEAQAILDAWLAGDKTEESFAALANEKSEDPGSNTNGGLYENVYKGQMVEPFETWSFDESRAYGDTGLVQTSYGYHVMYYVGSEPVWISYAESDWVSEKTNQFLEDLTQGYPMEVEYDKISLGYIDIAG